jgi:hypothetical protein
VSQSGFDPCWNAVSLGCVTAKVPSPFKLMATTARSLTTHRRTQLLYFVFRFCRTRKHHECTRILVHPLVHHPDARMQPLQAQDNTNFPT